MKSEGLSKTVFLAFAAIIAGGVIVVPLMGMIAGHFVAAVITSLIVFGILGIGLMIMLGETKFKLNDDFHMTFVRIKKFTLPEGVSEDEVIVDDDEELIDDDEELLLK